MFGHGAAHFVNGEILELADAFSGDVELLPDLFEGEWVAILKSEAILEDFGFTWFE